MASTKGYVWRTYQTLWGGCACLWSPEDSGPCSGTWSRWARPALSPGWAPCPPAPCCRPAGGRRPGSRWRGAPGRPRSASHPDKKGSAREKRGRERRWVSARGGDMNNWGFNLFPRCSCNSMLTTCINDGHFIFTMVPVSSHWRGCSAAIPVTVNAKNEPSGEFMGRTAELWGPAALLPISQRPITGLRSQLAVLFKQVMEVTLWPLRRCRRRKLRRGAPSFMHAGGGSEPRGNLSHWRWGWCQGFGNNGNVCKLVISGNNNIIIYNKKRCQKTPRSVFFSSKWWVWFHPSLPNQLFDVNLNDK